MSASDIAYRIQSEQGWADATLLDIVLNYIGSQQSDDAFEDYLAEHAAEENDDDNVNPEDYPGQYGQHDDTPSLQDRRLDLGSYGD